MVKIVLIFFITTLISLNAAKIDDTIYDTNCVRCHSKLPVAIDKYFYRYLLKYSSEKAVKAAMIDYMKNPSVEKTIMSESFITRFGIKKKTNLSDDKLMEALDIYWDEYKIFDKLK